VLKQVADIIEENTKLPTIRKITGRNMHIKQSLKPETFYVLQLTFFRRPNSEKYVCHMAKYANSTI
jgi:hypothetical protein